MHALRIIWKSCLTCLCFRGGASDGHVYECLAGFGHGPLDKPAGRYMGDTSTLFVLELYELYRNTGNTSFMTSVWPGAVKAIHWCTFPSLYYGLFPYNP